MAANEPPDEGSGRPPISSFDVPIDESDADAVEAKREERKNAAALPVAAQEALKLKGLGFTVMPLPTNAKSPPVGKWEQASKNNPAVFLKNPGTHNYAIQPPPGCFGWDVDKDAPELLDQLRAKLGFLPMTLITLTPNGEHLFFRWPSDLARPKGPMFGQVVTRWPFGEEGQGYLVGPGSVVVQDNGVLGVYRSFGLDEEEPIADLPRKWAEAALAYRAPREVKTAGPLVEVGPHYELPESVPEGGRYDAIVRYTAHLYNRGLSSNEMWPLVQAELAPKFTEQLTRVQLRDRFERAVRDIGSRLGEPKALANIIEFGFGSAAPVAEGQATGAESDTPSQAPGEGKEQQPLFIVAQPFAEELRSREPITYLVPGWVPAAGLTVFSGHPKSMKSMALLQMLGVFVAGGTWMDTEIAGDDVRVGLYLTREGSHAEMLARTDALLDRHGPALGDRLRFSYEQPIEFDAPSYQRVAGYLAELESEMSVLPGKLRVMLVLDPLRDLLPADSDENEAKTMGVVKRWCRSLIADFNFLAVVVVHHNRKSATTLSGLEMAGSGATFGAADNPIQWRAKTEDLPDDDRLVVVSEMFGEYRSSPRGDAAFSGRWRFDAATGLIVPGVGRVETASGRAMAGTGRDAVLDALRGVGVHGASAKTVAEMVGIGEANARKQLGRLLERNAVVKEGGYWYVDGSAPFQQPDVVLPVDEGELDATASPNVVPARSAGVGEAHSRADGDGEVWVDPLHSLDS